MGLGHICKWLLGSAGFLALVACGGGSVTQTAFVPAAPATPTPTQFPPSLTSLAILPGITASTQFATLGIGLKYTTPRTLTTDGFDVSYDAAAGAYLVQLPGNGTLILVGSTPISTIGELRIVGGYPLADATVVGPANAGLPLSYSALIGYDTETGPNPFGWLAFGKATGAGAVPVSGSATYSAIIRGYTLDQLDVRGSASLQFDFGAGKLLGHLDPILTDRTGLGFNDTAFARYDLVNTIYSSGSTTFSGQLSTPAISQPGSFEGLFTGPAAQELIGRWNAPAINPITNQNTQIFGAMIGKRP